MVIMNPTKLVLMIVAFSTLALLLTACSPSTARLTADGNDAFAKQAYEEARQAYAEAQAKSPELAEPYYNAANVLYREGKYEDALKALQTAAQVAQSDALAQNSYFNAGNAAFNTQGWDAAIESYRQALLRNPDDLDAKVNLELALQQKQQQEQQDQQDEQNQEQQEQQNQDQQQQDGQDQQDQQNQDQQQQDGQSQQDQQNQDQQRQDGQGQQDQQQGQQGQQDRQDQQGGQDGQAQAEEQQDGDPQDGSQLAPGQRLTQDQARQLLATIAGKSDTLQSRLGQFLRVRSRPPVQDW
jgi:Ca-activated chloride channel homolog